MYHRMPYAAIYTSLGCPYNCTFCCIHAPFGKPGIRYRNPELVVEEIAFLVDRYGIRNIKIIDELFVFDEKHYMTIVALIIKKGFDLNIWAYARVDFSVKEKNLKKMKKAGMNSVALGIESGNLDVRDSALKTMRADEIKKVVRNIQDAGIRVIGNYIFGLPEDTVETMQETLDMAIELNCEFANFYLPWHIRVQSYMKLQLKRDGNCLMNGMPSPHSYETLPLPTKYVSAEEVLKFRDDSFHKYFSTPAYLEMIDRKFGKRVREHIQGMAGTRLKRKALEN